MPADEVNERWVRKAADELAPESENVEQFLDAFGMGSSCEKCGKQGLDDDDYTDCVLVLGETEADPPTLLCFECAGVSDAG